MCAPRAQHRVLHDLLGLLGGAEHAAGDGKATASEGRPVPCGTR
ncbi:MAG: hypothetical protein AVDCRST_MAG85-2976 [uncultured Solirubrobacteraceae bacterium]|uniref:Uncharacterized protein n=1 Tax=uncultured Solirubrobacteraceae bacterium TaxID=1162706 RepID=A0A6J4TGF3_9ACTN|nr:MAG: hypothetical protein AVDCRST_MAG85-2976 [uncultured Solirubrobacteraceae bacterium]